MNILPRLAVASLVVLVPHVYAESDIALANLILCEGELVLSSVNERRHVAGIRHKPGQEVWTQLGCGSWRATISGNLQDRDAFLGEGYDHQHLPEMISSTEFFHQIGVQASGRC